MKTKTRYFGEIDYTKDDVITLPKGLFGFEAEQRFLLLPFSNAGTLYSLQSLKTPELAFTLMHPFTLHTGYAPVLQEEELEALHAKKSEELYYYVMCTVKEPIAECTVNMKCPLAINPDIRCGMQVILEDDAWEMRHKLSEFGGQEDKTC